MSTLTRIALRTDWPQQLHAMFPGVTRPQIEAFGKLAEADQLVDDCGEPTEALVRWCGEVR